MATEQTIQIAPQAALNEYGALVDFYRNRNLWLAQQVHELSGTVEQLRTDLAETNAALEAAVAENEVKS